MVNLFSSSKTKLNKKENLKTSEEYIDNFLKTDEKKLDLNENNFLKTDEK